MRVVVEDIGDGMINIDLGLKTAEIDHLIHNLQMLKESPGQHFHVSSNFDGACRIGQITFYNKEPDEQDDILISSRAYAPGESIPD
jgi:hypothetical protein